MSAYELRLPNHRGKRAALRLVCRAASRRGSAVVCRMRNGALLALEPQEILSPGTVGWSCFHQRSWEPHVERALRELLAPGDTAYDVGANVGYFSAVMAQVVGAAGRVVAFEPVPRTFALLERSRELNAFLNLTPVEAALAASAGAAGLAIDPGSLGQASLHRDASQASTRVAVRVARLDDVVASMQFPPPTLIKIDVEGGELAVLDGAVEILARSAPAVVFELNVELARGAGWGATDVAARLRRAGDYRLWLLEEGGRRPVEPEELDAARTGYVDVLALAS